MYVKLNDQQRREITAHTLACYPQEMCGLLTLDDFIPLINTHAQPDRAFSFSALAFAPHIDRTIAIVHSHTRKLNAPELLDLRTPSYVDMQQQQKTNLPWLIVGCESLTVTEPLQFPRQPNNDYLGRRFTWFINDCYTLVQDWYRYELNIKLPAASISENYQDLRHLNDLFEPFIRDYGFSEIPFRDLQDNDLVLLDNAGFNSNHLGIYHQGQVLHQDMISVNVPLETFLGRIKKVLRYEG